MTEKDDLFRQEALANTNHTVSRFGGLLQIISPYSWLALAALYLILFVVGVWSVFGRIPTHVKGQGVLMVQQGSIYTAVAPTGSGRVIKLRVMPGDRVRKGQIVAELEQADLNKQISTRESYIEQLKIERETLSNRFDTVAAHRQSMIKDQNNILRKSIRIEQANLANLEELVRLKQQMFKKGIETKEKVVEAQSNLYRCQATIEQYKDRITQNNINKADYDDKWQQQLLDLKLKIEDAQFQLDTLQEKQHLGNTVKSPTDGVVIGIQTSIGSMVSGGSPIVNIASLGINQGMDVIAFVPVQDGKKIKTGMTALISPSTIKREEFGSILAKVETVSQFPVTKKAMMAILQNEHLVNFLSKQGPTITVRINLKTDPNTYSGYAWSSSLGPEQHITPGSLANARITVRTQAPISLVIPALKHLLQID